MNLKPVNFIQPPLGCDVEGFFRDSDTGEVIGSEKIIKNEFKVSTGKLTKDGVQLEFNPTSATCRETLRSNIANLIEGVSREYKDFDITIDSSIEVSQKEFDSLSDESKEFGCLASFDGHNDGNPSIIKVKGTDTLQRTAGGHIHIGYLGNNNIKMVGSINPECIGCPVGCVETLDKEIPIPSNISVHEGIIYERGKKVGEDYKKIVEKIYKDKEFKVDNDTKITINYNSTAIVMHNPVMLAQMCDLVCGIPCTLLDRGEDSTIRRKIYGRAGDYRLPPHGFEYRSLSNFWLKSPILMSFVMGMARQAFLICHEELNGNNGIVEEMWKGINKLDVKKAIDNNDYEDARDIFLIIQDRIIETAASSNNFPIYKNNINHFKRFVLDGYKEYIHGSIFVEWKNPRMGFERFSIGLALNGNEEKEFKNTILK